MGETGEGSGGNGGGNWECGTPLSTPSYIGRHMAVTPFKFPPLFRKPKHVERTSDGGNGNHSVSLPIILIKIKVNQMLPSSYISSLLVSIL